MTTMQHPDDSIEHAPAAWRRPGVVFVLYAYRVLVALLVATPFAFLFGSSVGGYPRADALLFDDGGLLFFETIRRSNTALPPLFVGAGVGLAVASFLGIVPLAALIGALGVKGRLSARDVGAFAFRPVGTFALLFGAFAVVQALVFALLMALAGAISRRASFQIPTADGVKFVGFVVALSVVSLFGVWQDLTRVAVVREDLRFRPALRRGWNTLRKGHVRVFGAWFVRALLGGIVMYAALSLGSRLGVDSGAKVVVGSLVYQASIILALFLKASWFAAAIRHLDHTRPVIASDAESAEVPEVDRPLVEVPNDPPASQKNPVLVEAPVVPVASLPAENSDRAENLDAPA